MNLELVKEFRSQIVYSLNESKFYGYKNWIALSDVSLDPDKKTLYFMFVAPDLFSEQYGISIPMNLFNEERVMQKHLADQIIIIKERVIEYHKSIENMNKPVKVQKIDKKWWEFWK